MSPPFCYQPSNPDITGIGVRSSAYVSFFMSVLVTAYCATKFYSPPKAFASIRRARLYAYLAIVFASLIQGRQRQLSVFHSFAAAHLAQLILYAGFAEPVLFWAAGGDEDSTGLVVAFTGLFNIFYTIFVSIGWLPNSPAAGESSPYCTLDDSGANGYDGITWVVLLTIPTRNGWFAMILFFMPIFLISAVLLIVGAMNLFIVLITGSRKHLDAKSSSFPLIATLIIFLLIGVHEVVSIERSLMSNSGIDNTAEDAWSFGLTIFLLIAFIDPFITSTFHHLKKTYPDLPGMSPVERSTSLRRTSGMDSPLQLNADENRLGVGAFLPLNTAEGQCPAAKQSGYPPRRFSF